MSRNYSRYLRFSDLRGRYFKNIIVFVRNKRERITDFRNKQKTPESKKRVLIYLPLILWIIFPFSGTEVFLNNYIR
jgi:hypothetical protein